MTQGDKELLLRDLCARLPYGVMCDAYPWQQDKPRLLVECVPEYHNEEIVLKGLAGRHSIPEAKVKPYLRPLSSMTEEEKWEEQNTVMKFLQDFYNERHLDYRGLIEKGLALEAPEGMYA